MAGSREETETWMVEAQTMIVLDIYPRRSKALSIFENTRWVITTPCSATAKKDEPISAARFLRKLRSDVNMTDTNKWVPSLSEIEVHKWVGEFHHNTLIFPPSPPYEQIKFIDMTIVS